MIPDRTPPRRFRRYVIPIVLMFVASAAARWRSYDEDAVVSNMDASYHAMLTVVAMDRTPASVHHFLPIVTLGRPLDRDVQFGVSVRGPGGVYYYTSFPPLGFVAPWAFFRLTHLSVTIRHLMVFNFAIHLAATLLLALIVCEAVDALGVDRRVEAAIVLIAAASYLFTFEALQSHGVIYWHHSLFQIAWLVQLLVAARVFRRVDAGLPMRGTDVGWLAVMSILAPSIEWTGYLTTISLAALCFLRSRQDREPVLRRLGMWMSLGAFLAGVLFIVHFASVLGVAPLVDALRSRASARSAVHGSIGALADGYAESFGALLWFVACVAGAYWFVVRKRLAWWSGALVVATLVPLSENLLLSSHATLYHFDRLKVLVTIVIVSGTLITLLPTHVQRSALVAWAAVLVWNLGHLPTTRVSRTTPLATNHSLLERVRATTRPCAIYAMNAAPRGWVNLTLGANTYESVPSMDSLQRLVDRRGACQGVYFVVDRFAGQGMYLWLRASIYDRATGRVEMLQRTEALHATSAAGALVSGVRANP